MLDFSVLKDIRNKAVESMVSDSDDEKVTSFWKRAVFIILFYIAPIFLSAISWHRDIKLSSLESYIGASIAIFTGLFFSLLISIGGKVRAEKANPNKDDDNFQKFKTNMKQIANITLYVIVYGVIIFLVMLLNSIFKSETHPCVERIFTVVAMFLLVQYTVALFFMLQRFYYTVRDELNNIL